MPDFENSYKAYSVLTVEKAAQSNGERVITGVATTPSPDRAKDVINPMGLTFAAELPLLLHHDYKSPVGTVRFDRATTKGITFIATIADIAEPGALKDRCDEAWQSVKAGLIRGVSIGFGPDPSKAEYNEWGGITFNAAEVRELSLVTIPCNQEATINTIKSLDQNNDEKIALNTTTATEVNEKPALNDQPEKKSKNDNNKVPTKMSFETQIKTFTDKKAQLQARLDDVTADSLAEGRAFDEAEQKSFDEVTFEIDQTNKHLENLKRMEKMAGEKATPIAQHSHDEINKDVTKVFAEPKRQSTREKGLGFAEFARIMAQANGNPMQAEQIAKSTSNDTRVYNAIKAASAVGSTTSSNYAALAEPQLLANEFIELLRPRTIVGQLEADLRRIPFNRKINGVAAGTTAGWVGEGQEKPTTEMAINSVQFDRYKVAGIATVTEELLNDSTPSVDRMIRDDLLASIAGEIDAQFILPSRAGVAGVSPASITNDVTAVAASGQTAADLRKDLRTLFSALLSANISYANSVIVMSEVQALQIAMLNNTLGQPEFPTMNGDSKSLYGVRVVTSEAAGSNIVLLKSNEVYYADDSAIIRTSREATINLNGNMVNMFQHNSIAILVEQFVNFAKRRDAAVQYISGANYDGAETAV